jgi:hypothetical protein
VDEHLVTGQIILIGLIDEPDYLDSVCLMKEILNKDVALRPTLDDILKDEWFG